jgi:hypothetical protein
VHGRIDSVVIGNEAPHRWPMSPTPGSPKQIARAQMHLRAWTVIEHGRQSTGVATV